MIFGNDGIVNNGLIAYFNGAIKGSYSGSGSTWVDLAGSNDGTITTPSFTNIKGGSFSFNGNNDYVNLGSPSSLNFTSNDFTIDTWVYPLIVNYGGADQGTLISKSFRNIELYFYEGGLYFYHGNGGGTFLSRTISTGNASNSWYNIVLSRESGVISSYQNNVFKVSHSAGGDLTTNIAADWWIGNRTSSSVNALNGYISIVRFYNRALSVDEINQNFQVSRKRFGV